MIRGIYASAAGMGAQEIVHMTKANNLANSATTGFKRDVASLGTFAHELVRVEGRSLNRVGEMAAFARPASVNIDMAQGPLTATSSGFHLAVDGDGFFVVHGRDGIRYTRAGDFRPDSEGYLSTSSGYRVLGQKGWIHVGQGLEVKADGTVHSSDGEFDRIRIEVQGTDARLRKAGHNLFELEEGNMEDAGSRAMVVQGALEMSNVSIVREMAEMIAAFRVFEACQKSLTAQDTTLDKAVNDVGRLS